MTCTPLKHNHLCSKHHHNSCKLQILGRGTHHWQITGYRFILLLYRECFAVVVAEIHVRSSYPLAIIPPPELNRSVITATNNPFRIPRNIHAVHISSMTSQALNLRPIVCREDLHGFVESTGYNERAGFFGPLSSLSVNFRDDTSSRIVHPFVPSQI